MKINEVIVVEGEHDATRIKQLFDADFIVTNGSAISQDTLNLIKQVNTSRGIIVFCDPDFPGEQIRKKIMEVIPHAKHAFVRKEKAIDKKKNKVGVEHVSDDELIRALEYVVTFNDNQTTITWNDYLKLGLVGNKQRRMQVCDKVNIGYCNAKTLYKRLNMLSLSFDDLLMILGEIDE